MKYLTILKFIVHYILVGLGKLIGYIVTPLVYPHRDWLRNYIWNWMQVNDIKCNRSTIWAEDEFKYYTKNGYITKRKTNEYLGYVLVIPYFMLDDDSDLNITSRMFHKSEDVIGLNIVGSYFDLGDRARENKISIWKNWGNFKKFYYWMVIRNGFYNFNYIVEDGYLNACGTFDLPEDKRIHKKGPNKEEFSIHHFFQDSNGKWFFRTAMCKHYKGFAYGYEVGWYRTSSGGVNAKIRLEFKKPLGKADA